MTPSEANKDLDRRIEALTPTAYFAYQLTMDIFINPIINALFKTLDDPLDKASK